MAKEKWVVQAGADSTRFLQDRGSLKSVDEPYGGPGYFGPLNTAFLFDTKKDAKQACYGLLGRDGRRSTPIMHKLVAS